MSMLKDEEGDRPADAIAPGATADGKIAMMTPAQAAKAIGERDADEEAFNKMLGFPMDLDDEIGQEDLDDVSDLDDSDDVE